MASQNFSATWIYYQGQLLTDHCLKVAGGRVESIVPLAGLPDDERRTVRTFNDSLIFPGLINTHTHSFQSLLKGFCDDKDFFHWRDQGLYKYARILTEEDIYTGALFAFSEMLLAGITTVCDFFYIHDRNNRNAEAVIRAAGDLGMRIVMARTMYDWGGAPERFQESVDQAVDNTRALMTAYGKHPTIKVIPAPHSLHGASIPMIQAGAELAESYDTVFHMHIAEGQYERQMMLDKHGLSPIAFLDDQGLLTRRTVGIHCVWLDDAEIQQMAERGAMVSYNPASNMFLGDGITRLRDMLAAGITVGLGTDGGCSNNRASILDEMRMASLLQKVHYCDSTVTTAHQMLEMGTVNGGRLLDWNVGQLSPGYGADFMVVNLTDLSVQPRQNILNNLVYAMQPSAISAVYVAGQLVMESGQLMSIPIQSVAERVRETTANW